MSKTEEYTALFEKLCTKSDPAAFVAITIDEDLMTSFVCSDILTEDAADVLEQMAEFLRAKTKEETADDQEPTKH